MGFPSILTPRSTDEAEGVYARADHFNLQGARGRSAGREDSWYLYVVEKTDEGHHRVLSIKNPVRLASKWILCGESWRMVAENGEGVSDSAEFIGGAES